jgi:radical SAM-linked protein
MKYLSHLELMKVFVRALRRAGVELTYSKGFHPMPKITFADALPVGTESLVETVDIGVAHPMDLTSLMENLNTNLPEGICVTHAHELPPGGKSGRLRESNFLITIQPSNGSLLHEEHLHAFLSSTNFPARKVTSKGERRLDLRSLVKDMKLLSTNQVQMTLTQGPGPRLKPIEILGRVFYLSDNQMARAKIVKTGQVLA